MSYTNITIGRLTLRETFELSANISAGTDTRSLLLNGEESAPPLWSTDEVWRRQEDILGLQNRLVPIRFGTKSEHDGWYRISDVNTAARDYQGNELVAFTWNLQAERIGRENTVDLESRLTGVQRINDHGLTGEKWHAPAPNSTGYYTGPTQPSGSVSRTLSDGGSITVYRSVPASANPRWAVDLVDYQKGRCRVYVDGFERTGTDVNMTGNPQTSPTWIMDNGLVSVELLQGSPSFRIAAWDGTAWDQKSWNIGVGSSASNVNNFERASIIRNDYEQATVRIFEDRAPGRCVIDLTLRRGSRFLEGYLQNDASSIMAIWPATGEASTSPASSGYVRATSNDAQGNRYVCGSARSFTALTAAGGLAKTSTRTLDFFIGAEVAGSAAVSGDQAANLVAQYLTAMSEVTVASVR